MTLSKVQADWLAEQGLELIEGRDGDFSIEPIDRPHWLDAGYRYVEYRMGVDGPHISVIRTGVSHRFGMTAPVANIESEHDTLKEALWHLVN